MCISVVFHCVDFTNYNMLVLFTGNVILLFIGIRLFKIIRRGTAMIC